MSNMQLSSGSCDQHDHNMPHFGFTLSQQILKLGLKIKTFSKFAFPGLFLTVFIFISRWPKSRNNDKPILLGLLKNVYKYKVSSNYY